DLRREDEAAADAFCGRNLPLMGYSVDPIIRFLMQDKDKLGSHKYYKPEVRADIIRRAAQTTQDRQRFSKRLFNSSVYSNPYTSLLIVPYFLPHKYIATSSGGMLIRSLLFLRERFKSMQKINFLSLLVLASLSLAALPACGIKKTAASITAQIMHD